MPILPWLAFVARVLYGVCKGILTIARGTLPLVFFGADGYGARVGLLARPFYLPKPGGE